MKMSNKILAALLGVGLIGAAMAENAPAPGPMMGPGGMRQPGPMGPGGMRQPGPMGPGAMSQGPAGAPMPPAGGPFAGVEFSEKQRQAINELMDQERQRQQQRLERIAQAQEKLRSLYMSERWDPEAIGKVYDDIFAEQRKSIEAMARARNRVYEMLTKEQREQMKRVQEQQAQQFEQMEQRRRQMMEQRGAPAPQ